MDLFSEDLCFTIKPLYASDVITTQPEVLLVTSVEGRHQGRPVAAVRQAQGVAELVSCHLEHVDTWTRGKNRGGGGEREIMRDSSNLEAMSINVGYCHCHLAKGTRSTWNYCERDCHSLLSLQSFTRICSNQT